ncbi:MAG TPA: hypothetical protein VHS53_16850 [Mucilaginibacter sp.]|nr:hypothetical protein [Mucilaginibacter sp.]
MPSSSYSTAIRWAPFSDPIPIKEWFRNNFTDHIRIDCKIDQDTPINYALNYRNSHINSNVTTLMGEYPLQQLGISGNMLIAILAQQLRR